MPAVVDDEDIKTKMEQVIRQFGILYVAFNATWTDDDDTIVFLCVKADKVYGNVVHAREFCFFPLTPEICQWPHRKSSERVFSRFPVLLLLKHRVSSLVYQVKIVFFMMPDTIQRQ